MGAYSLRQLAIVIWAKRDESHGPGGDPEVIIQRAVRNRGVMHSDQLCQLVKLSQPSRRPPRTHT
jgi:hypothetical protein